jgi:NAD(P)-dependent dehydrogenase (short-subunit alcohol dehydrogenase family)
MSDSKKTALVTGSGRGIGCGIALQLASAGYDVGLHYGSSGSGAEDIAEQIRQMGREAFVMQADLRNINEIKVMVDHFIEKFGHIDVLVNNAGVTEFSPFLDTEESLFDNVISIDLKGTYFCTQAVARYMVSQGTEGTIIHISSNHSVGCWPGSTVYASAKAGINKLTKNMAMELSKYGIRVVGIAPGYTHKTLSIPEPTKKTKEVMSKIPMGRFCTPQEVGNAVVFLASKSSGYITGTILFIDGGALLPVATHNDLE